jgi:hypothetical protein
LTPTYSLFICNLNAENHCKNAQSGGRRPPNSKRISQGAAPEATAKKRAASCAGGFFAVASGAFVRAGGFCSGGGGFCFGEFNLVSAEFNLVSAEFNLVSAEFNLVSAEFNLVSAEFNLISAEFSLISAEFGLFFAEDESLLNGGDLVSALFFLGVASPWAGSGVSGGSLAGRRRIFNFRRLYG